MKVVISKQHLDILSSYFVSWEVSHALERVGDTVEHTVTYSRSGFRVNLVAVTSPSSYRVETNDKAIEPVIESIVYAKDMYRELTGCTVFPKKNYLLTKNDRHLFFVNKYGVPSFVTRDLQFIPIHVEKFHPDYAGTLIDGEISDGIFYATEVLFGKESLYDTLMGLKMTILRMRFFSVSNINVSPQ
jgi:hypothetical protein